MTQLLISKANSATIYIALDDLCVKSDSSNLDALKVIIQSMLSYLKSRSMLRDPEAFLMQHYKIFDHYMDDPEERMDFEVALLHDLEVFLK